MHRYFIKTPWWVKKFFSNYLWRISTKRKEVFLTFDDGPHPVITPWVLQQLSIYNAKATFFCIGENVTRHPAVYRQILSGGHSVGNHTQHHLNGWKTTTDAYVKDVAQAADVIKSNLFRPPYGRIKHKQAKAIAGTMQPQYMKIVMWDVLSADFDQSLSPWKCAENVLANVANGSIVVLHDSEKAFGNLREMLPVVLEALQQRGYAFSRLEMDTL